MGFQCKGCFFWGMSLMLVVQIGVALADPAVLDFFNPQREENNEVNSSDHNSAFPSNNTKNLSEPDSKFHILIQEVRLPLTSFEEGFEHIHLHPHHESNQTQTNEVPAVEFDKLKDAAKQAGLSDAKADRVARAAKLMNASFEQLSDLRKVMLDPATSAGHADQVRQKLEEAAIQQQTQLNTNQIFTGQHQPIFQGAGPVPLATIESAVPPRVPVPVPVQLQSNFQPNPNPVYPNPNLPNLNARPVPVPQALPGAVPVPAGIQGIPQPKPSIPQGNIDPLTLHRLNVSSTLAGLHPNETARLLRAIVESDLNATEANKLQNVITQHAATADDLKKFTDVLEKNVTFRNIDAENADLLNAEGSDWLYSPTSNSTDEGKDRVARSFLNFNKNINIGDVKVFSAVRHCGVSPKYPVTQFTNVAPGQFPWSVAVYSSDDIFQCSGSLISESIVLTTATCVLKYRKTNLPLKLVVGAWDLPDDPLLGLPQVPIFAKSAVTHALYSETNPDIRYNIGLLRLTENIDFDLYPHIFPICIVSPSLLDPSTLSDQCTVTGWPDLPCPAPHQKPPKSFLTSASVTGNSNSCPQSASKCINGPANIANEGSPVICPGSTQRYYQWGVVATEPVGKKAEVVNVAVVSVVDNYDFIARYLWTTNPDTANAN